MLLEEMGGDLGGMGFGIHGNEEDYMMRKPTEVAKPALVEEEKVADAAMDLLN